MPGRKATHSAPVPWDVAVRAAGSQEKLCAGVPEKTWDGWRRAKEVPAYRALPFLLEQFSQGNTPPKHGHLREVWVDELERAVEQLRSIYWKDHGKSKLWKDLSGLIGEVAPKKTEAEQPERKFRRLRRASERETERPAK